MEWRSQKATGVWLTLIPAFAFGAEFRYQVKHDHLFCDKRGELVIDDNGVAYREANKKDGGHGGQWKYPDIRQLWLGGDKLVVLTHKDDKWRLGIDQEYEFRLMPGENFLPVYEFLKNRLDRRLVVALPETGAAILWQVPVKLTGPITGSEGLLKVGPDQIVYETPRKNHSRIWRYQDIDNISTSDPYELTITTFERAKLHYGSRRAFAFRLKEPLHEHRYNLLWRQLQRIKYGAL